MNKCHLFICAYVDIWHRTRCCLLTKYQLHFKHAKSHLSNVVSHLLLVYDLLCFGLFVCLFVCFIRHVGYYYCSSSNGHLRLVSKVSQSTCTFMLKCPNLIVCFLNITLPFGNY